jgi:hypothetical protein
VLTDNTVQLKARCRMANRPTQDFRIGKVKAADWLAHKKAAGVRVEPLRLLNVPGGIRTCDLRFRNS